MVETSADALCRIRFLVTRLSLSCLPNYLSLNLLRQSVILSLQTKLIPTQLGPVNSSIEAVHHFDRWSRSNSDDRTCQGLACPLFAGPLPY